MRIPPPVQLPPRTAATLKVVVSAHSHNSTFQTTTYQYPATRIPSNPLPSPPHQPASAERSTKLPGESSIHIHIPRQKYSIMDCPYFRQSITRHHSAYQLASKREKSVSGPALHMYSW